MLVLSQSAQAANYFEYIRKSTDGFKYRLRMKDARHGEISIPTGEFSWFGTKWRVITSGIITQIGIPQKIADKAKPLGIDFYGYEGEYPYVRVDGTLRINQYGESLAIPANTSTSIFGAPFSFEGQRYMIGSFSRPSTGSDIQGTYVIRVSDSHAIKLNSTYYENDYDLKVFEMTGAILKGPTGEELNLSSFSEGPFAWRGGVARTEGGVDFSSMLGFSYEDLSLELGNVPRYTSTADQKIIDAIIARVTSDGRHSKSSVILGNSGVGKTTLAMQVLKQLPPGWKMFSLDAVQLTAGAETIGVIPNRIKKLIELSKKHKIVWYIDEFHTLSGAGAYRGNSVDAMQLFKTAVEKGDLILMGATTSEEYYESVGGDAGSLRRYKSFEIDSPSPSDAKLKIKSLLEVRQISLEDSVIDRVMKLSERYDYATENPGRSVAFLDAILDHSLNPTLSDVDAVSKVFYKIPSFAIDRSELQRLRGRFIGDMDARVEGFSEVKQQTLALLERGYLGLHDGKGPLVSILLDGDPGIGKTFYAESLAKVLGLPYVRIEMNLGGNDYTAEDIAKEITKAVRKNPFAVLNLDELDKCPKEIMDRLLKMFDDGILSTQHWLNSSRTQKKLVSISVRNAIVVFTSNDNSKVSAPLKSRIQIKARVASLEREQMSRVIRQNLLDRIAQLRNELNIPNQFEIENLDRFIAQALDSIYVPPVVQPGIGFNQTASSGRTGAMPSIDTRETLKKIIIFILDRAVTKALLDPTYQTNALIKIKLDYLNPNDCTYLATITNQS